MILLAIGCATPPNAPPAQPATIGERLGDRSFLVPIDALPTIALVAGGSVPTTAASCGTCHPDHYADWSGSTHAYATRDLQYIAELAKPGQPRWLCLNCHAPTRPQRWDHFGPGTRLLDPPGIERIAATPEPLFDPARVSEGVTCATCHVRRAEDGEGLVIGPRGNGRAPHRVRHDPDSLRATCERCHSPGGEPLTPTFVCWFETAQEVAACPRPDVTCVECHMPVTTRAPPVDAPTEQVHSHFWSGGGVPKTFEGYAHLIRQGWTPGVDVEVATDPLRVVLTNARAAHLVPTGDPERHLQVVARLEAQHGVELARDSLRIGQHWDWGDEAALRYAHRIDDSRLVAGERRTWTPALPTGGVRVVVEVSHVRLTEENAASMRSAVLDPELVRLYPGAVERLPEIERYYPFATLFYREVVPLDGSARTVTPLAELLAR